MPVTKCEECGFEISMKSDICLNCGEKIYKISKGGIKSLIRRIIFVIIALYMLLSGLKVFDFFKD
ncbi:MAG: hypothetical protein GTO02_08175 [Candidatus Dadabacteria bacterium]|nr:hypothetical protein [Candidatus Dadabacteria bacterium]NIQ14366.1 hypothetical protein [Candidatus Dadabacteria bacterium]